MVDRLLIRAGRVIDAEGRGGGPRGPGALLVEGDRVLAAGTPQAVGIPGEATVVDRPHAVVMPGLVNAHCHLDLSHLPPEPYAGDFAAWIDGVRLGRVTSGDAIAAAVRRGLDLSRAGGTAAVGDVAGGCSPVPYRELAADGMAGVSFVEVIGFGAREPEAVAAVETLPRPQIGHLRLGVSPHAPYTCGPDVFRAAAASGLPVATHLAETPQEIDLLRSGTGPLAALFGRLGLWDPAPEPPGVHPIDHLAAVLAAVPVLAAHVNYVEPRHLTLLASAKTTVVYCPRAAAYFGHTMHRYREMLAAGVNVALGTDGLACLDTPDRISVLDEMRLLHRRDATDPMTLLAMATTRGAAGLGLDPRLVTFASGPIAGVIAVGFDPGDPRDALVQVLQRDDLPEWISAAALSCVPR